jgi:hypothetical protein
MLDIVNAAMKSVIDLLKLKKDVKKTDLEISKLEREKKQAESFIQLASLDDIKKYDPRARDLHRGVEQSRTAHSRHQAPSYARRSSIRPFSWIVIFLLVALVWWIFR